MLASSEDTSAKIMKGEASEEKATQSSRVGSHTSSAGIECRRDYLSIRKHWPRSQPGTGGSLIQNAHRGNLAIPGRSFEGAGSRKRNSKPRCNRDTGSISTIR
jgi:hypothetical protein